MLAFDKRGENRALSELIAKGADLTHAQIGKKVLHFEYIVK
jgi:hypothetical protein